MDNSDPVSPKAYWLPVSLILPAQPIGAFPTISDVRMKGLKGGGAEVTAEEKRERMTSGGERNGE